MKRFKFNIAVIGIGRVGLPFAITLASEGFSVIGIDVNPDLLEKVNNKIFPFHEPGYQELIEKVDFKCSLDPTLVKDCENIIITVGTPLLSHIESDLSQIKRVLKGITTHLKKGHNIILRSTIAPKTTVFVKHYLEQHTGFKVGFDLFLSFCPERLAEGYAMKELKELPQIIGSEDRVSARMAEDIFGRTACEVIHTDYISAELVKLFTNISRYIHFSIANQFAYIADDYGANIYDLVYMSNHKYPRGVISQPGMTAGTCLRKDFGMINEAIPYTDLLLSAWKINEFTPKYLIENLKKKTTFLNNKVAILGYTFKNDVDDTRDSLVPKLVRYIERENPSEINIHEPNIIGDLDELYYNYGLDEAVNEADIIIFAINHSIFKNSYNEVFLKCKKDAWFSDIWNIAQTGKIFYKNPKI